MLLERAMQQEIGFPTGNVLALLATFLQVFIIIFYFLLEEGEVTGCGIHVTGFSSKMVHLQIMNISTDTHTHTLLRVHLPVCTLCVIGMCTRVNLPCSLLHLAFDPKEVSKFTSTTQTSRRVPGFRCITCIKCLRGLETFKAIKTWRQSAGASWAKM